MARRFPGPELAHSKLVQLPLYYADCRAAAPGLCDVQVINLSTDRSAQSAPVTRALRLFVM